eukprot:TRINITY_DN1486_c0_g1_i2.p1 TRINITY_DN1486_c0_g1~~TRINITY_DN1486_c0_g1_i2.p1  ORF type:complete len:156 (-),score=20.06 TRINITY_DN1486_c0_g1_i2:116-583(-)
MDSVSSLDIRSESIIQNASPYASTPPSSASQSALCLSASSDDVLRLLASSSNGIDPSRIWKNGASVQLLVPGPSPSPFFPIDDSKSVHGAGGMLPPPAPVIRRPPNPYQLFCSDVRPSNLAAQTADTATFLDISLWFFFPCSGLRADAINRALKF